MSPVVTSAEYLAMIKRELKINDATEDQQILELTNEALIEAAGLFPNNRGLEVDEEYDISQAYGIVIASLATGSPIFLTKIHQIYYHQYLTGAFQREWDMTEFNGLVYPAPVDGKPNSYTINQRKIAIPAIEYEIIFSPKDSGTPGDKIRIVATGIRIFTAFDVNNQFDAVDLLPFVKRSVIHRMALKKNQPQVAEQFAPLIARVVPSTTNNSDVGDQVNDTKKNA